MIAMYETGKGSYKMRATYHADPKQNHLVIINALPYQVSGNKVVEQIAKLMMDKNCLGLPKSVMNQITLILAVLSLSLKKQA